MLGALDMSIAFESAYVSADGFEPTLTTKCADFAATIDFIFVSSSSSGLDHHVNSVLSMPYQKKQETSMWLGNEAVSKVAAELGASIPSLDYGSDHLAIGCDILWKKQKQKQRKIVAVGAADTFFKVGHHALRLLLSESCEVRLALPVLEEARKTCAGMNIEYVQWTLADFTSLDNVCAGCTDGILVSHSAFKRQLTKLYRLHRLMGAQ
jgi:hypothetical protein